MKLPRLDGEEVLVIVFSSLMSQALFLALALVGLLVLEGLSTGNWFYAIVKFGWIASLSASVQIWPLSQTLLAGSLLGIGIYLLVNLTEKRAAKNEEIRENIIKSRQGLHGELPRLPIVVILILMSITGICEELLFRYVLIGLVLQLLSSLIGPIVASVIAVIYFYYSLLPCAHRNARQKFALNMDKSWSYLWCGVYSHQQYCPCCSCSCAL